MKQKWVVGLLVLLNCWWLAGSVLAATLTVPDQYYSVQYAVNAAQSGDTVYVRAGTYTGDIVMKDNVSLVGEGADVTTLKLSSKYLEAGNNALIEGFTITGYGIRCNNKSPFIKNNVIRNAVTYGVSIFGNSWPTIFKNYIYNNQGGIYSNSTATIVNNTIVDNFAGYGIRNVTTSSYPAMNNLVLRHDLGILSSSYSNSDYSGGYNDVYGSRRQNFWYLSGNIGDIQQDPLLTNAPVNGGQAYKVENTAGGWDTVYFQYDWTSKFAVGDYVEVGYDKIVRQVTEVSYDLYNGYNWYSTRVSFNPPLPSSNGGNVVVSNWGDSNDFTYDFTYQIGSPCIDSGNPDPQYLDADGSINDIGAVGGTDITPSYDPSPPAPVSNLTVSDGDAEAILNWTPPADPNLGGYLILRSSEAAVDGTPVDGMTYRDFGTAYSQSIVGNAIVVYAGQEPDVTSFVDRDLMPGVQYHYAVFSINEFFIYSSGSAGSVISTHMPQTFTVALDGTGDFSTVGEAIAFAKPTDTVYLTAGQYRETIIFKNGVHLVGESMDSVTLLPVSGEQQLIRARGCEYGSVENLTIRNDQASRYSVALYQDHAGNLDVKNVRIDGFSTGIFYRGVPISTGNYYTGSRTAIVENSLFENNGTGIYCYWGMSPKITGNTFTNNSGTGVYNKYYCNSEISSNHFEGNGTAVWVYERSNALIADNTMLQNGLGIGHAWSSNPTILRNVISDGTGNGIYAVSYSSPAIISNIISRNGGDGMWLFLNWPKAYNNTIIENAGNGLTIQYYGSVELRNNIIAFNTGWGTYAGEDYYRGYPNLYYNDLFGNGLGETSPYSRVYGGNIFTDPLLVNVAESNYQLTSASPCIDAGDPNVIYNDQDGSRNNMGAYGGPEAMIGDEPTIDEEIASIVTTLVTLPDNAFKNEPTDRKGSFEEKLSEVLTLISDGSEATDPLVAEAYYNDALNKLENDLLKKSDGHFGGNPNNDWITSYKAQSVVYPMVIDLINEVQMLLNDVSI